MRKSVSLVLVLVMIFSLLFLSIIPEAIAIESANTEDSSASWTCDNCGHVNTTNFCEECGAERPGWTCVCGKINYHKFCGDCGRSYAEVVGLNGTNTPTLLEDSTPEPKKDRISVSIPETGFGTIVEKTFEPTPEPTPGPTPEPTPDSTMEPSSEPQLTIEINIAGQKRTGYYSGDMKDGVPHGQGSFVSKDELPLLRYVGSWDNGKTQGKGTMTNSGYTIHFDTVAQGAYDRTGVYEGDVIDGIPVGKGKFTTKNDEGVTWTYTGEFSDGTFNGYGEMIWDQDDYIPDIGLFTNGEFTPTWSQLITVCAKTDEFEIYDSSIAFIDDHESVFISDTEIDSSLFYDNWTLDQFKKKPSDWCSKLRIEKYLTVAMAEHIEGYERPFSILVLEKPGMILLGYIDEYVDLEEGAAIDEICFLPLNWISYKTTSNTTQQGVFCAFTRLKNQRMRPSPTPSPEPTPNPYTLPADADRSVTITTDQLTVPVGKKITLEAQIEILNESAPDKTILVWSSSNEKVAKVSQKGVVSGIAQGEAEIVCSVKDRPEIKTGVTVNVKQPIKSIRPRESKIVINVGSEKSLGVEIKPVNAWNKNLSWESSDQNVAKVIENNTVRAMKSGDCVLTCTTTDGSNLSAKIKVHVPTFHVDDTEYTVYNKTGIDIPVYWDSSVEVSLSQNSSCFTADWNSDNSFKIVPLRAGTGSVTLSVAGKDSVTIQVTIASSAVYDTRSYPQLDYKSAYRYPDAYKNDKVSFSGTVSQVIDKTTFRISSRGRYNDIVYVTISSSDLTTPLIEDDKVTVYGKLDGNYTYTTVLGSSLTIPKVVAEKIIVR